MKGVIEDKTMSIAFDDYLPVGKHTIQYTRRFTVEVEEGEEIRLFEAIDNERSGETIDWSVDGD